MNNININKYINNNYIISYNKLQSALLIVQAQGEQESIFRVENSPLKFTELFQEMRDTRATQGLEVALQNSSIKCLLRSYRCAAYWK